MTTVVSTGAPLEYLGAGSAAEWRDLLSTKSRQIVEGRSLHSASLRSASVETTGFFFFEFLEVHSGENQ